MKIKILKLNSQKTTLKNCFELGNWAFLTFNMSFPYKMDRFVPLKNMKNGKER